MMKFAGNNRNVLFLYKGQVSVQTKNKKPTKQIVEGFNRLNKMQLQFKYQVHGKYPSISK